MATLSIRTLLAGVLLLPVLADAQPTPGAPAAGGAFAVAYVEARADSAAPARAALARYRDAAKQQTECLAVEVFEQAGRPGRFAVLESWRDQAALDARDPTAKNRLLETLRRFASAITTSGRTRR
jgi:quinol monooxygenase YgiN